MAKPGFVRKYISVTVILQSDQTGVTQQQVKVFLASVNWLTQHEHKEFYGSTVEVWEKFIPCTGVHVNHVVQFSQFLKEEVTLVVPINPFIGLN